MPSETATNGPSSASEVMLPPASGSWASFSSRMRRVHDLETLHRVGDVDGQEGQHQGDPVVRDRLLARGPHRDGYQRAQRMRIRRLPSRLEQVPEAAGDGGQGDVVDGDAVSRPYGADVAERSAHPGIATDSVQRTRQGVRVDRPRRRGELPQRPGPKRHWCGRAGVERSGPTAALPEHADRQGRELEQCAGREGQPRAGVCGCQSSCDRRCEGRVTGRGRVGRGPIPRRRRPCCGGSWTPGPSGHPRGPRRASTPTAGGCDPSVLSSPG